MINISQIKLTTTEIEAINKTLRSGQLVQGEVTEKLESEFAKYHRAQHAIAVNSGTAALHCALYALGIKAGDEVITSPFTFAATANAILMLGATPVFVDIDESTFNLDPSQIEAQISKKTKAILTVDLYGQLADYVQIRKIAKKYKLPIVADSCQAIGAELAGQKVSQLTDIACFSLYATKNMMCGEGGMITTNSAKLNKLCRQLRNHGQKEGQRYEYVDLGFNYRLTDVFSSLALEQLKKVDKLNKKRLANAKFLLAKLKNIKGLILPTINKDSTHVFHQFTIHITPDFVLSRAKLMAYLLENGIASNIYYPKALHEFSHFGQQKGAFPITEKISSQVLSLPVHPFLKKKELLYLVKIIQQYGN